jgi:glycosyltransferase involved in cell wall biosynthesis
MRILHYLGNLEVGGIQTQLLQLSNFMRTDSKFRDWQMEILYHYLLHPYIQKEREEKFKQNGFQTHFQKCGKFEIIDFTNRSSITSFLHEHQYDCIVGYFGLRCSPIFEIAQKVGIPKRIVYFRNSHIHHRNPIINTFYPIYALYLRQRLLKFATHILSNSHSGLDCHLPGWQHCNNIPYEIVRNGIDSSVFDKPVDIERLKTELNIPLKAKIVGHVSRFHYLKNYSLIVNVAEQICQKRNDVYFLLCGDGVKEGITPMIAGKKCFNRFITPGRRDDIASILRLFDVFIFPSIAEGQPNALMEAMIAGIPFVASHFPAIKELIPENVQKFLLSPYDVDGFTKEIETILENSWSSEERNFIATIIRDISNPEKCFRRYLKILES